MQERLQRLREASRGCVAEGRVDPGIDSVKGMTVVITIQRHVALPPRLEVCRLVRPALLRLQKGTAPPPHLFSDVTRDAA